MTPRATAVPGSAAVDLEVEQREMPYLVPRVTPTIRTWRALVAANRTESWPPSLLIVVHTGRQAVPSSDTNTR